MLIFTNVLPCICCERAMVHSLALSKRMHCGIRFGWGASFDVSRSRPRVRSDVALDDLKTTMPESRIRGVGSSMRNMRHVV